MPELVILIKAIWDDDAKVWVATSENLPGLVTEADTIEQLNEKLSVMIPELLDGDMTPDIPIHLIAEQSRRLRTTC